MGREATRRAGMEGHAARRPDHRAQARARREGRRGGRRVRGQNNSVVDEMSMREYQKEFSERLESRLHGHMIARLFSPASWPRVGGA